MLLAGDILLAKTMLLKVMKSRLSNIYHLESPRNIFIPTMQCLLRESLIHSIDHSYLVMNNFWWLIIVGILPKN